MFKPIFQYFLVKYDKKDYLKRRKAALVMFFAMFVILALNLGSIISLTVSVERMMQFFQSSIPATVASIIVLVLLRKGKSQAAANTFVILCTCVVLLNFIRKPPETAYVSMVYFMFVIVLFAAVFSSRLITSIIMLSFVAADFAMFFMHRHSIDASMEVILKTGLIDSFVALLLAYLIALLSISVFENSIMLINKEQGKSETNIAQMKDLHALIRENSITLKGVAGNMSGTTIDFSRNIERQAKTLDEITVSTKDVTANITRVSMGAEEQYSSFVSLMDFIARLANEIDILKKSAGHIAKLFSSILDTVKKGDEAIRPIEENSRELEDSSQKLIGVMEIIGDIFDKIQLLALNASIEAARAGEHGKGFAVVASEVNKLSDQSVGSIKEINEFIQSNMFKARENSESIGLVTGILSEIVNVVNAVEEKSRDIFVHINSQESIKEEIQQRVDDVQLKSEGIKNATRSQDLEMSGISKSITSINELIQSNIAAAQGLSATAEKLARMADDLAATIGRYREE